MIFLSLLSRKVNQIAGFLGHFPLENIDSTPILAVFPRESEPYSHESWALSPSGPRTTPATFQYNALSGTDLEAV